MITIALCLARLTGDFAATTPRSIDQSKGVARIAPSPV
jgi:hypothetical protein